MTIIESLSDPDLFGALPAFQSLATWTRWLVFLKAVYGLPLTDEERAIFCHHTGQSTYLPPRNGWQEVVAIVGRQSGKTRIATLIDGYEAAIASSERDGTELYALLIAQDQRGAIRTLFSYAKAPFELVPMLASQVEGQTADTLRLANGVVIAPYPCRPAAVRGVRACVVVCDELAYYRSSENLPIDVEMLRAVRPCLATTGGKLIILSSPYGQTGALWELYRQHYGRDDAPVLVWQASAPEMNPTLPTGYLARMATDDPEAYRSEVLGEFRVGLSTLLDPDAILACVATGIRERAPAANASYRGFCDPSGGRRDKFAVAVGHRDGDRGVLDVVRSWAPPFNPAGVVAEAADLLKAYGMTQVTGDRYAAEFVAEQFRAHGVTYRPSERDRSDLYLDLLPLVNAQRIVLLDHPDLLRELRGLERRRGASGRDRVDHRPGEHDDLANAVAGCVGRLATARRCPYADCRYPGCDGSGHLRFLGGTSSARSGEELQKEEDERAAQASQASAEQIVETCRREGAWGFGPSRRYAWAERQEPPGGYRWMRK